MTYTITITDEMDENIQYYIDNKQNMPFMITTNNGKTVNEYLQNIIDLQLSNIKSLVNTMKDRKMLETVKNDVDILASVNAKIEAIKAEEETPIK